MMLRTRIDVACGFGHTYTQYTNVDNNAPLRSLSWAVPCCGVCGSQTITLAISLYEITRECGDNEDAIAAKVAVNHAIDTIIGDR